MTTKVFTNILCKRIRNPKHFHLYPPHGLGDKNPFFTKFGDSGQSKVYAGEFDKDHLIFEAIGATEELTAFIGLAREFVREDEKLTPLAESLRKIQLVLIDVIHIVSSLQIKDLSVDKSKPPTPFTSAKISIRDISDLETLMSQYGTLLPPVEKIVIPGGGKASAALHLAKTVCRRCERILVTVFKDVSYEKDLLAYINRLSSYLSQAARISAKFANRSETVYKPIFRGDKTKLDE